MLTEEKVKNALEKDIIRYISQDTRDLLKRVGLDRLKNIEEIRLRAEKPLILQNSMKEWFVDANGRLTEKNGNLYVVSQIEVIRTLELMSENSIYAYQDEIRNGFITLKGGHRVGIAGKVVLDGHNIRNIKEVSGLNIRISREVRGCSSSIIKFILKNNTDIYNTLIISPPQCGKTTMLRDITRVLSDGIDEIGFRGMKIGVIDERSEIAACYKGVPQNDLGLRTDVLDGCPKSLGMPMMLRSMSPQVIVTDEIGDQGDRDAVMKVINAGVKIITTAHGYNISELRSRQEVLSLIEQKVFERYIVLSNASGPGTLEEVIDGMTMKQLKVAV